MGISTIYRASRGHGSQFDDFYYFSKDLLFDKLNIYQEYSFERTTIAKYPPFFAVLFAPFVPLPYLLGAGLWFLINLSMLYLATRSIARIGWRLFKGKGTAPPATWMLVPVLLTLVVVMSNLATSQVNIFVFSLVMMGLDGFIHKQDSRAGLLLGLATSIKLTPGLFILYFAYKKSFKTVFWAGVGTLACWGILLPIVMGPEYYMQTMNSWIALTKSYMAEGTVVDGLAGFKHTNQSLEAAFFRFFTHTQANGGFENFYVNLVNIPYDTADLLAKVIKLILLVILIVICRSPLAERNNHWLMFEFSLVYVATLYISPISWINHYIAMILPFATSFYYVASVESSQTYRKQLFIALAFSVILTYLTHPIFLAFSLAFLGSLVLFIVMAKGLRKQNSLLPGHSLSGSD